MPFNAVYNKKRHLKLSVSVSFSGAGASTDSRIYIRFLGRVRCAFWFRLAFLLGFTPNPPSLPPFYCPPLLVSETGAWFCWRGGSWRGGGGFPIVRVLWQSVALPTHAATGLYLTVFCQMTADSCLLCLTRYTGWLNSYFHGIYWLVSH